MFLHYVEAISKFGFEPKKHSQYKYTFFFYLENTIQTYFETPEYRNKP